MTESKERRETKQMRETLTNGHGSFRFPSFPFFPSFPSLPVLNLTKEYPTCEFS